MLTDDSNGICCAQHLFSTPLPGYTLIKRLYCSLPSDWTPKLFLSFSYFPSLPLLLAGPVILSEALYLNPNGAKLPTNLPTPQIAASFRTFGISDKTTDLLIVKLGFSPDTTAETIAKHLESAVEGTWAEFDDSSLTEISDILKIKKIYKLQDFTDRGQKPEIGEVDKSEMEAMILGLMALRGAS
ncbi:hypothetical protein MMC30_001845 [Trapelia coarctata]|nr:hypothetical protein [Trapelia coarctata]